MVGIVTKKINLQKVIKDAVGNDCGAVVVFIGTVRNENEGKAVTGILYESYREMAERHLNEIVDEIRKRWKRSRVSIVHRIGRLKVGEVSVAIAIGTPHRKDGFDACRYAIERIKEYLPVWKLEFTEDGRRWVKGRILRK